MKYTVALLSLFWCVISSAENFAVLLAKDKPDAPAGFPTNWPVQVQPIGSLTNLPPQYPPPWRFATGVQVEKWKTDHAAEMAAYQAAQESDATQPKRDREAAIRKAVEDLILIRDSSGTLTAAQVSNALRALAKSVVALIEEIRP